METVAYALSTMVFGRVVKALDLKSNGFTRASSNLAADEFFFLSPYDDFLLITFNI